MTNFINEEVQILIIDDERMIRNMLSELLGEKYVCKIAGSAEEALSLIQDNEFQLIISDIDMGGMSGIDLIPHVLESLPDAVIIMISGMQTIESAIEAMRRGAFDYIQKPFDLDHVEVAVERALNHQSLLAQKRRYENHLEELIRERTDQLNYLAYHDARTDLPNRTMFESWLMQSLAAAPQEKRKNLAVVLVSIDRFKKIQDSLGHSLSYRILQEAAERLKKCVDGKETVARLEGDEFALLLAHIRNTKNVVDTVNSINEIFKAPVIVDGREVFVTVSMGISLFPEDGKDNQTLMKNAGAALTRAKEHGGNNFQFYTAEMNARALRQLEVESKLRRALEREEFEVYYQPKVDTTSQNIIGMEALVRWKHPELGLVSPNEFIPLAEETGLIIPIGEWVLKEACAQSKLWKDKGYDLNLSVNLSARQFQQKNLSETVIRIIRETEFNPQCLELEITESSIMTNPDYVVKVLAELKMDGIKISIDDFGVGHSSLSYLKSLPIDVLKIDKSFISDITNSQDDASLVMAIINLSHNLRLKVIAEGVETEEQLKLLHLLKCDAWQGFLCSKPVPAKDFEELLRQNK